MSYATISPDDFVISSEAVASALWADGVPTLSSFFTSSPEIGDIVLPTRAYNNRK